MTTRISYPLGQEAMKAVSPLKGEARPINLSAETQAILKMRRIDRGDLAMAIGKDFAAAYGQPAPAPAFARRAQLWMSKPGGSGSLGDPAVVTALLANMNGPQPRGVLANDVALYHVQTGMASYLEGHNDPAIACDLTENPEYPEYPGKVLENPFHIEGKMKSPRVVLDRRSDGSTTPRVVGFTLVTRAGNIFPVSADKIIPESLVLSGMKKT